MSFVIVTDTSANLPPREVARLGITVIPFSYYVGDREYQCTDAAAFDYAGYYNAMREGTVVTTSQINPGRYIDHIEPLLQAGQDVLFIGLSSGVSGSFSSAQTAIRMMEDGYPDRRVRLIDSLGASMGEGLLVLRAAAFREQGMTLDETADALLALRPRICQIFTVADLMYLRRTGRVSNVTAVVGTVLNIKPLLKGNENGQIVTYSKARGRKKAIEALADQYAALVVHPEEQVIAVAGADCREDAELLISLIRQKAAPKDIITVDFEPVTGSHVGPDMLALFFEGDEDVRLK